MKDLTPIPPAGKWVGNLKNDQRALTAQILSLYSLTNSSSAGYLAAMTNFLGEQTDQETKAYYLLNGLFGSVIVGNSAAQYNNIRYVLDKLGVPLGPNSVPPGIAGAHEHHFHVTMAVPKRKDLPNNLLALNPTSESDPMNMPDLEMQVANLFAQANPPAVVSNRPDWLGVDELLRKALAKAIVDRPRLKEDGLGTPDPKYSENGPLGMPALYYEAPVEYAPRSNGYGKVVPNVQGLWTATGACSNLDILAKLPGAWGPECKITKILQYPKGKLVQDTNPKALTGDFLYTPRRAGTETMRFIIENGAGKKVDVTVKIRATLDLPEGGSITPEDVITYAALDVADSDAWLRSAQLSALLASAQSTLTGFSDLPTTALGQTTGEGASAQITLDSTAAGHGWYVDPTPLDATDEYLPTSQEGVWQAKAGTAAAGKMDLLSVLLHEYGHALGLVHSGAVGDFMNAALQTGQRRLPTAAQLQHMSDLVAQLRAEFEPAFALGSGSVSASNPGSTLTQPALPGTPGGPDYPGNPLSLLGLLPLGLMRRNDGSLVRLSPAAAQSMSVRAQDYMTALYPHLTSGSFQNGLVDWEQAGAVSQQGGGTVTVGEAQSSTGQTRLAQAFVLNAKDRFLTFTVNNLALQNNSSADESAPQDAFEVALLNANTGTSLWTGANAGNGTYGGTSALSKTDALLSLQLASSALDASVQERTASVVSSKLNTDGSRTYLVDLRNVAAGTPVNLSSDTVAEAATVTAVNHAPRLGNQCLNGAY